MFLIALYNYAKQDKYTMDPVYKNLSFLIFTNFKC